MSILTLAIIGPLLRPGTVLLLDWVPGPRPQLSSQFWGFPPGPPNRAPIELITWFFDYVAPWGFVRLLPIAAAPALAAWGFWRIFRPDVLVVLASTLFLIVNPFVYERMLAGHLYLVLGVALLPLLLSLLMDGPGRRPSVGTGLVLAGLVALSVHFFFIAGVLVLSFSLASLWVRERRGLVAAAAGATSAALLSVYWILPAVLERSTSLGLGEGHLEAFKTRADPQFGLLPNVLGLYGFWRAEWPLPKHHFRLWPLVLGVLLLVAVVGFWDLVRRPAFRGAALTLAISSGLSVLLALGPQGPTGPIFVWLFEHLPGFAAMRESQKFLALLVLGYATTFGWGVKILCAQARTRRAAHGVAVLLLVMPIAYGFRELWGLAGWVRPSTYPQSWSEADRLMGAGEGRVLALPWHQYLSVPFAGGRILSNPAASFFSRDAIISNDPEVAGIESVAPDDLHAFLDRVIFAKRHERFGRSVAPLGVEYVLLQRYVDYRSYSWLDEQSDLKKVREWRDLVLYRNTSYAGALGWVGPFGDTMIQLDRRSEVRYEVRDSALRGPLRAALIPGEGWHYGGTKSRADRDTVALFAVEEVTRGTVRYLPWLTVRIGYVIGVIQVVLALLLVFRSRVASARFGER